MFSAVIFDFDGVIADTEPLHLKAFNSVLEKFGAYMPADEYYEKYLGYTDAECFAAIIKNNPDLSGLKANITQISKLVKSKHEVFEKLVDPDLSGQSTIIEGVLPFLKMLKDNSIPMAVCSGALRAEICLILEKNRLQSFFEVIVSAEDVRKGKPDPEGFVLTLKKLNEFNRDAKAQSSKGGKGAELNAKHCVVFEDSKWGLAAAKAAGMRTVAVTNSYDAEHLALADKIVTRLDELDMEQLNLICS